MKLWCVYYYAPYENEWGHRYFAIEENARACYAENDSALGMIFIREIETED